MRGSGFTFAASQIGCEKPLTKNTVEAKKILIAAESAKRLLFLCRNYKYAPVVKVIEDAIRTGKIGEVTSVTQQAFYNANAKGVKAWRADWRLEHKYSTSDQKSRERRLKLPFIL
jgi:predicted dehydrogenase